MYTLYTFVLRSGRSSLSQSIIATPETIPVKQLRGHLSEVTDAVAHGRRFVVTRNNKPRMALVTSLILSF